MKKLLTVLLLLPVLAFGLPAEINVGPKTVGDGTTAAARGTKDLGVLTGDLHGRYYEATTRAATFTIATAQAGVTQTAAMTSPPGAATATILTLYNPVGSGKNLEVLKIHAAWVSGTPTAAGLDLDVAFSQVISAAQNATPVANMVSGGSSVAKGYTNTALTGGGAYTYFRPMAQCAPFAAALAATSFLPSCTDEVEGAIVLPPGAALTLGFGVSGTTSVVTADITYQEATP